MSEPTCKDRVNTNYQDRMSDLRKLWDANNTGIEGLDDLGNIYEYGLCFDYVAPGTFRDQRLGYFRYQLSTGGPGDEFRFYVDNTMTPYKVEYWFLDWFDGAHKTITSGRNFDFLVELFDWFSDCGSVTAEYERAMC